MTEKLKFIDRRGTPFVAPKFEVPDHVADAMENAKGEAAHPYGDEGAGYEADLIVSYFLENPEVREWLKEELKKY